MTKLPLMNGKKVVKAFKKFGWKVSRQSGSHIIMTKDGEIAKGTLRSLIRSANLSVEEFSKNI